MTAEPCHCACCIRFEFWRLEQVERVVSLKKSEIYRRIAEGTFPRSQSYPGTNKKFWVSHDIMRQMAQWLGVARYRALTGCRRLDLDEGDPPAANPSGEPPAPRKRGR